LIVFLQKRTKLLH